MSSGRPDPIKLMSDRASCRALYIRIRSPASCESAFITKHFLFLTGMEVLFIVRCRVHIKMVPRKRDNDQITFENHYRRPVCVELLNGNGPI